MRGAIGNLIAEARAARRPRWSQEFLADELTHRGFPTTRNQIARLELSPPNRHKPELLAAAAEALQIPTERVAHALLDDYTTVAERVARRLSRSREA